MSGRLLSIAAGLCFLSQGLAVPPADAEPRVALVIGNSHYGPEIGSLPNPVNDANLIAQALQQTGFQVIKVTDVNQKKMKRAIADFGDKLASAGPEATGLFFYAGHGVQVRGMNYLVPIGADISKEADVDIESVSADTVLQQMEFAGSRVNIVVLDACRNNPLGRSVRSMSRGLAPMDATQGTFVAYSTAPGQVASDGSGKDSPYSAALARTIVQPGLGIEEAFRTVRAQVMKDTGDKQVPWDSSSLTAAFYFKSPTGSAVQAAPAPAPLAPAAPVVPVSQPVVAAPQPAASAQSEIASWNSISSSRNPADYQNYLGQFPHGAYAPLARSRLKELGNAPAPAIAPAAQATQPAPVPAAEPESDTTAEDDSPEPMVYADTVNRGARRSNYGNHKSHDSHSH